MSLFYSKKLFCDGGGGGGYFSSEETIYCIRDLKKQNTWWKLALKNGLLRSVRHWFTKPNENS